MDLNPVQQKAVFIVVVVVLAALGYWLLLPKLTHSGSHGPVAAASTPSTAAPSPSALAGSSAPAQDPAPAASTTSPAAAGNVNIYSWLPFTQQDLAAAAAVTVKFGVKYNTFTYTESSSAYVAAMSNLITGQLATTLQASYATPGVVTLRTNQKQVSTGTASIVSLRAFGPSSLTFVVTAAQRLVSTNGTSRGSTQYAITVTGSGRSWQVSDIELSSAGNS